MATLWPEALAPSQLNDAARQMMTTATLHRIRQQEMEMQALAMQQRTTDAYRQMMAGHGTTTTVANFADRMMWGGPYAPRVLPEEEQIEALQGQIDGLRQRIVERKQQEAVRERAMTLFKSWLSPEQLQQYDHSKYVDVTGSEGGRYRIHEGGAAYRLNERGEQAEYLCFYPENVSHINGDKMLAQKVSLESDEGMVRQIARVTRMLTDGCCETTMLAVEQSQTPTTWLRRLFA